MGKRYAGTYAAGGGSNSAPCRTINFNDPAGVARHHRMVDGMLEIHRQALRRPHLI